MNPKRLYSDNYEQVLNLLIEFYNERPDSYGLMERPDTIYSGYARFIEKYTPKKGKVLDLGTGTWKAVEEIAKYDFSEVVGLDYFSDEKLAEYSKELTNTKTKLVQYNNDGTIPFPDNYFDCVTSLCVMEHIMYVEKALDEIHRVLKPGGVAIIQCPNWSGINVPIMATLYTLKTKDRRWQLTNPLESFLCIFRSIKWYFEVCLSSSNHFIMVYPRIKNNKIDFERSDDDVVHLCQPFSFKKYFTSKGYSTLMYNRGSGSTLYSRIFNNLFPNMATTNELVFRKNQ